MPSWVSIFLAAVQILAKVSPLVISQFHGGAHDTATKVGSALDVVNTITSNLAAGNVPLDGVGTIHHTVLADAHALAAAGPGASTP